MFGRTWHHNTLRKYVIYFGTLFNNLYINRTNAAGATVQTMKVPLNYGPKEKFLARLEGNPDLVKEVAITLPRMSFEMTGISYSSDRKLSTINKMVKVSVDGVSYQYMPVPYDIEFTLSVMVKNAEDGTKIIEQILPYFTPEWTNTLNIIPDIGYKLDVPVILQSVNTEDSYEGNFETRRAITWTLTFVMKGMLFGPTIANKNANGGLITQAEARIYSVEDVNVANAEAAATTIVTPGLDANGNPTSNSAASIPKENILPTDNYGFIIDFTESDYP